MTTRDEKLVLHGSSRSTMRAEFHGKRYRVEREKRTWYFVWLDDGTADGIGVVLALAFNLVGVREVIRLHATGEVADRDELQRRAVKLIGKGGTGRNAPRNVEWRRARRQR
jgi:hypothetical protein